MKFNAKRIEDFKNYERVRQGGKWNMFTIQAIRATGLDKRRYGYVMDNYSELAQQAAGIPAGRKLILTGVVEATDLLWDDVSFSFKPPIGAEVGSPVTSFGGVMR